MENNRLNFFADTSKQIFLIIGGLVAITTLVPLFINRLESIFGLSIRLSYYLFVLLYFIFPVLFYLFYCSIYDYVGFLKLIPTKIYQRILPWKSVIETSLILVVFWWLRSGNPHSKWLCIPLYFTAIGVFSVFLILPSYKIVKKSRIEFGVIGIAVIVVFSLFLFTKQRLFGDSGSYKLLYDYSENNIPKNDANINDAAFTLFQRQKHIKDTLLRPIDSLIENYQNGLLRVAIKYPNRRLNYIQLNSKDSLCFNQCFGIATSFYQEKHLSSLNLTKVKDSILISANLLWPNSKSMESRNDTCFRIYNTFLSMQSYLQTITKEKDEGIKKYWALLISTLQVKGLTWFFFLIILCLCLWLQSTKELAEKRRFLQTALQGKMQRRIQDDIQKITDNSDQVRSLFYMLILLVIPFFKTIDEKTVSFSMPFLDFGIQKYYDQNNETNEWGHDYTEELNKIRKQLETVQEFTREQRSENEKTRKRLNILSDEVLGEPKNIDEYNKIGQ